MFCPNCGKEIDGKFKYCEYCHANLKEATKTKKNGKLKDFVLKWGRILIDLETGFSIGVVVILTIIFWLATLTAFKPDEYGYFQDIQNLPAYIAFAILFPIILLVAIIIIKYLIYLLIDIRDSLSSIAKTIEKGNKDENMS